MSQNFNIFEHHHGPEGGHDHENCDHDHDHGHDPKDQQDLDPAQQAAADALKFSFFALKLFMIVVAIFYVGSGFYQVSQQENAIELRFGALRTHKDAEGRETAIVTSGQLHYCPPYPLGQVIKVPIAPQTLTLSREFWWENSGPDDAPKAGPLDPEKDGSLLTADANIVHMRWDVTFSVTNAVDFIRKVAKPSSDVRLMSFAADAIVRAAAEDGVVFAVAQTTADEVLRGVKVGTGDQTQSETAFSSTVQTATARAQKILDQVRSGITINSMTVKKREMPSSVRDAYTAVITAETERGNQIEIAKRQASSLLGETAGNAQEPLAALILQYQTELARAEVDKDAAAAKNADRLKAIIDTAFDDLKIYTKDGKPVAADTKDALSVDITGKAAGTIFDAVNYRTSLVAQVEGEANTFNGYYQAFKDNAALRKVVMSRLWLDAKESILTGDVETMYLPKGQTYLELNRDPTVARAREEKRLREKNAPPGEAP